MYCCTTLSLPEKSVHLNYPHREYHLLKFPVHDHLELTPGGVRRKLFYLNKSTTYENMPANHKIYIKVCLLH